MSNSKKAFVAFEPKLFRQLDKEYFHGYDILGNSILLLHVMFDRTYNIVSINIAFKSFCFNSLSSNRPTKNHINRRKIA